MVINNIGIRKIGLEEQHLRDQMRELRSQIESLDKMMVSERKRLLDRKAKQQADGLSMGETLVTDELIRFRLSELREDRSRMFTKFMEYNAALQRAAAAAQSQSTLNL